MPRAKKQRDPKTCPCCGADFIPKKGEQIYCGIACVAAMARLKRWEKSKEYTRRQHLGYWEIKLPNGRWIGEHRYWYQEYWGVTLGDTHYVMFLNGDHDDFSKENLVLRNKKLDQMVKETGKLPAATKSKPAIQLSGYRKH